jgi:hypothetical protein
MVILWFFLLVPLLIGRPIGAEYSAVITFIAFEAAYFSEIMRAGIQSDPRGQVFAGQAVGMTYGQNMRLVVLPQAFRNMLPVLLTQTIILFQDTSLVYAIGAYDLLKGFETAGKNYGRPIETYLVAAVTYFVICYSLSSVVKRSTRRSPSSDSNGPPQSSHAAHCFPSRGLRCGSSLPAQADGLRGGLAPPRPARLACGRAQPFHGARWLALPTAIDSFSDALWPHTTTSIDLHAKELTMSSPMIQMKNVSKWYGPVQVLHDCSVRSTRATWSCLRPLGLGQVHADQDRQRAGAGAAGRDRRQRHHRDRPQDRPAQAAQPGRHGVPALRAVPAPVGHREPDHRPDQGAGPQARRRQGRAA